MASFNCEDYEAVYRFARQQYFWHESTGRGMDEKAALIMEKIEEVIGQQSDFPIEARKRLAEIPLKIKQKKWRL